MVSKDEFIQHTKDFTKKNKNFDCSQIYMSKEAYKDMQEWGKFKPAPFYEPITDSMVVYLRDVKSYEKVISESLTVFLSVEDDSLVGVEINGVSHLVGEKNDL